MKKFLKAGLVTAFAALVLSGTAMADDSRGGRRPGLFEQMFGSHQNKTSRHRGGLFAGWGNDPFFAGDQAAPRPGKSAKRKQMIADAADPEGDPGIGMGNLSYVPPKMVPVSGVKLTAPAPTDPAALAVYQQIAKDGPSVRLLPAARDALVAQYAAQDFRPMWLKDGKLSDRGQAVMKLLAAAGAEGLEPQAYLPGGLAGFDSAPPENDPAAMARLDVDLSAAALRYARDASGGQFDPALLSRYNDLSPPWVPADKAVKMIAFSPFAAEYLKSLNPTHPAYQAMKTALAELREAQSQRPENEVPDGDIVKKGGTDPRIPTVRRRLAELGFHPEGAEPADPETLDAELSVQLRLFQKQAGIRITGALGPQTVSALNNADRRGSVDLLLDNMERLRWMPRNLGNRYVFVNQAAFEAKVIKDGRTEWQTRVIVGKPMTQTAVFNDEMEFVVFNPSWGVPQSIIVKEYLPKLRRDPGYLDRMGFKVVNQDGKVVSSRAVRWSAYGSKVPLGVQQPPGEKNALGELKFLFPNSHDIYMHDTPARELFAENVRAFSHGCVRVQNPREFASVVLGWPPEEVAARIESKASETVKLKQKLPVHIAYFTAWPDETGKIVYYKDIYGRDKPLENARSTTLVAQR